MHISQQPAYSAGIARMHTRTRTRTHARTHARTHTRTHARMRAYVRARPARLVLSLPWIGSLVKAWQVDDLLIAQKFQEPGDLEVLFTVRFVEANAEAHCVGVLEAIEGVVSGQTDGGWADWRAGGWKGRRVVRRAGRRAHVRVRAHHAHLEFDTGRVL